MNVKEYLVTLYKRIFDANIPLPSKPQNDDDYKGKVRHSIIADIQQRLAEIIAIIERETSDNGLNKQYTAALRNHPERLNSILNLISVLALGIKTKTNITDSENFFSADFFEKLDCVCFDCYNIAAILQETQNDVAIETYKKVLLRVLNTTIIKVGLIKP